VFIYNYFGCYLTDDVFIPSQKLFIVFELEEVTETAIPQHITINPIHCTAHNSTS